VKPKRKPAERRSPCGGRRLEPPAHQGSTCWTAVCGPACTVVWEGRAGDCSPYPDCAEHDRQLGGASPVHNQMEVKW